MEFRLTKPSVTSAIGLQLGDVPGDPSDRPIIKTVEPRSIGYAAGLRPGDRILRVNGAPMAKACATAALLRDAIEARIEIAARPEPAVRAHTLETTSSLGARSDVAEPQSRGAAAAAAPAAAAPAADPAPVNSLFAALAQAALHLQRSAEEAATHIQRSAEEAAAHIQRSAEEAMSQLQAPAKEAPTKDDGSRDAAAAARIQAHARGAAVRRAQRTRGSAATRVQAHARGRQARALLRLRQAQARTLAVIKLQAVIRGKAGRRTACARRAASAAAQKSSTRRSFSFFDRNRRRVAEAAAPASGGARHSETDKKPVRRALSSAALAGARTPDTAPVISQSRSLNMRLRLSSFSSRTSSLSRASAATQ